MFLGQENWAGRQQQQQQKWQPGFQQQRPAQAGEVGQSQTLTITGCTHDVVGPIIRGEYQLSQMNHGKPAYKKEGGGQGLVVMIYFWDERDGAANSGWWIGPQIGGNMVWGHHPNRTSGTPPTSGWQAPHSCPADNTLVVAPKGAVAVAGGASKGVGKDGGKGKDAVKGGKDYNKSSGKGGFEQQSNSFQTSSFGQQTSSYEQQQQTSSYGQGQSYGQSKGGFEQGKGVIGKGYGGKGKEVSDAMGLGRENPNFAGKSYSRGENTSFVGGKSYSSAKGGGKLVPTRGGSKGAAVGTFGQQAGQQEWGQNRWSNPAGDHRQKMEDLARKRAEDLKKTQLEQKSVMAIRKAVMKLKTVTPENFEALKEELAQILGQEYESCGSQKVKIQEESDKSLEIAAGKVEQIKEFRKKAEEQRKEMERKREEQQERARKAILEFAALVDTAETSAKQVREQVETFSGRKDLTSEDELKNVSEGLEEQLKAALEQSKAALDYLRNNGNDMKILATKIKPASSEEAKGEETPKEEIPAMPKVSARASAVKAGLDKDARILKTAQMSHASKAKAQAEVYKIDELFKKYDSDKDGILNKKEIQAYAKSEFGFELPKEALDLIYTVIVAEGSQGVLKDDFQRLKASVGVSRERSKDVQRRAVRVAREEQIAKQKEELKKTTDAVAQSLKDAESDVKALAERTKSLPAEGRTMSSVEVLAKCEDLETSHKSAVELQSTVAEQANQMSVEETAAKELVTWLNGEKRKLQGQAKTLELQLNSAKAAIQRFKDLGTRRDAEEVKILAGKAMRKMRAYMTEKKIKASDLFKEIISGADAILSDSYVKFMVGLPKADDEKEEEQVSEEELRRVFRSLDEEGIGEVSADVFAGIMRVYMKVAKDIAITDNINMTEGRVIRRLEIGEVVEVLDGPSKDGKADVTRIFGKSMVDGSEGWITMTGNQGSSFLKEGGGVYKVVKETILTETFDIEATKEEARKIKESTRKLRVGEFLEVREWGRKQESTALTRMKCKARNDGMVGWVTTVGNTGIKFVELA